MRKQVLKKFISKEVIKGVEIVRQEYIELALFNEEDLTELKSYADDPNYSGVYCDEDGEMFLVDLEKYSCLLEELTLYDPYEKKYVEELLNKISKWRDYSLFFEKVE